MVESAVEEPMDILPPSWFEFLLDRSLLEKHLRQNYPDPSATILLSQFIVNAEKCAAESGIGATALEGALSNEDPMVLAFRQKKCRAIRLLALQTCAFLNWDLDVLSTMHIATQHALMRHLNAFAQENQGDDAATPQEFLRVLFHRWVIRTSQSHNLTKTNRYLQQADQFLAFENIWKQLDEEESIKYLKDCITKPELSNVKKIRIPNTKTFENDKKVEWSQGNEIDKASFDSMIHFDLGVCLLHKGNTAEAVIQFQKQTIPVEDFPYLKISKSKLEGYLRAVGLLTTFDQQLESNKIIPRSLDHDRMVEITRLIKKEQTVKLKKIKSLNLDTASTKKQDRVNPDNMDKEDGAFLISGDNKLGLFTMEKRLIETTNAIEIKDLLMQLHKNPSPHQSSSNPRSFSKLFSGWELPIPVQHATLSIPIGAFQDYIYILVAKSRQLLISKVFVDARKMLLTAKGELQIQLQSAAGGVTPYTYNLSKLAKMMDWEILLIDITQFVWEYSSSSDKSSYSELKTRCKDCLKCLQSPSADVNPRSEIVENILITLINLDEYSYVASFDQMQSQRWPFVEFISLLARVCQDLFLDQKETSSNYRELWNAVLPIFSNNPSSGGGANSKKPLSNAITNKPAILSSRSALTWVIERSCSQPLLSVWVSLLARLHNHILDDVGLQIQADFLCIWPNILDDVTTPSVIVELKSSRVLGSSKLNSTHIRDFLFSLLERGIKIGSGNDMMAWLRCLGDVHLASGAPSLALKCYIEYFAMCTEFFERHNTIPWNDNVLFKRMIKCCELLGCFTQAVVLCQFLTEVDYSMAFGMAQEKTTNDSCDSLYGFIWDLTILEFLINLHSKRNETSKRQQATKVMGLLELNSNNNEEIQREAMCLRKSQFMRTLAKHYIFV